MSYDKNIFMMEFSLGFLLLLVCLKKEKLLSDGFSIPTLP